MFTRSQWSSLTKEPHLCRWTTVSAEKWHRTKSFTNSVPCNLSRMLRMTNRRVSEQVLRGQARRGVHPGRRTRWGPRRGLSTPPPRLSAQLRRPDRSLAAASAALPAVSGGLANICYASAEPQCGPRRSCFQFARFLSRCRWKPPEKVTKPGAVSNFAPAASSQRGDNNDSIGWEATTRHALRLPEVFLKETVPPLGRTLQDIVRWEALFTKFYMYFWTLNLGRVEWKQCLLL